MSTPVIEAEGLTKRYGETQALAGVVTIQPVVFSLLFVYVFGSGVTIPDGSYQDFALAGLLALNLTTATSGTAVGLSTDLTTGVIARCKREISCPAVSSSSTGRRSSR